MAKTNIGLVAHAKAMHKSGAVYLWGTYGKVVTKSLLQGLFTQYPSYYNQENRKARAMANDIGRIGVDCCGLIKAYMLTKETGKPTTTFSSAMFAKYDKNVGMMKAACSKVGSIINIPEIPGLLVFMGTHHVGIYIGNGLVIEAKGFNYGVVVSKLNDGVWDSWGKLSWITYEPVATPINPPVKPQPKPQVKPPVVNKKTTVSYQVTDSRGLWLRTKPSKITGVRKGTAEYKSIQEVSDIYKGWGYIPSKKLWMSISSAHTKKV